MHTTETYYHGYELHFVREQSEIEINIKKQNCIQLDF